MCYNIITKGNKNKINYKGEIKNGKYWMLLPGALVKEV